MNNFAQLTKKAFEAYHNTPYEPAVWTLTDALGHIMEFLEHHESINEMPGLREAIQTMTPKEWENWYERYPEQRATVIEPLRRELANYTA